MLSNFATEIIEEILLCLSYREFLRVIRLNRRLWSIAHHPKSPLRHRLRARTSDIHFTLGHYKTVDDPEYYFEQYKKRERFWRRPDDSYIRPAISSDRPDPGRISLKVSIDEIIPGSTHIRCITRELAYDFETSTITDEPYVENEEDKTIVLMGKSHIPLVYKTVDDLDDSEESYKFDQFSSDLSMRLALCHLFYIAEYFTNNKSFKLDIIDTSLLNKFLLHFDAYDIRLASISISIDNGNIDSPRLYESKLFQQKLYELSFSSGCKAIGNDLDFRHYEIHRNKLREMKCFIKGPDIPIKHNDDDLLLLDNIEHLQLFGEDEPTGDGIARLIKKIYENKQERRIYIVIDAKQKFTIDEVLKYVPECKVTRDTEKKAHFTNMFDEVFNIDYCCSEFRLKFSHTLQKSSSSN